MRTLFRSVAPLLLGLAFGPRANAVESPLAFELADSRVEIAVNASLHSFTGRLTRYEPIVVIDDGGRIVSARFSFQFRDVVTGRDKRDAAMHAWQQTDAFPAGVFVLQKLEPAAGNTLTALGQLTLHGVTRDIRFPVSVTRQANVYAIDGDAPIDVRDFGLSVIRVLGVLKVDPVVHVRFHLQGRSVT